MSLVYAPSALCFAPETTEVVLVGVGPFVRIFEGSRVSAEHKLFESSQRICGISVYGQCYMMFAEDTVKIVTFSESFSELSINSVATFEDWIVTIKPTSNTSFLAILRHGQFATFSDGVKTVTEPQTWKVATSGFIESNNEFLVGDSFGNITLTRNGTIIECHSSWGTVFGIDYKAESGEILCAYEYRTCAAWKVHDTVIENLWAESDHPSRVWGCKFLPSGPISWGEDGCVHVHDGSKRVLHLHRTKNITALASRGNEVVTGGQNAILRKLVITAPNDEVLRFELCPKPGKKEPKPPMMPLATAVLGDGTAVVGTEGGVILSLPSKEAIFEGHDGVFGWFLLVAADDLVIAASRSRHHVIRSSRRVTCFPFGGNYSAVSLAINRNFAAVIYSDNMLRIYTHDGEQKQEFALSEFTFQKPPIALTVHRDLPILAIGSHGTVIVILELDEDFSVKNKWILTSASNDGFQSLAFSQDYLFCAGRSDGMVTIFGKCGGEWMLSSCWRISNQCKSTVHIQTRDDNEAVVSVLLKEAIGIWDIATQTMMAKFDFAGQRGRLSIGVGCDSYSAVWLDHSVVCMKHDVKCIPPSYIGTRFHGLRGLCAVKVSNDVIVTGGCDRDVRVWKVVEGQIQGLGEVQAVDSGTHAVCFNPVDRLLFTGGSKEFLFVWRMDLETGRLFRQNVFTVGNGDKSWQLRITSLAVNEDNLLYVGLSDASIGIHRYNKETKEIEFIEKKQLLGVPVSGVFLDGVFAFATTVGDCYMFGRVNGVAKIRRCGVHCIRLFTHQSKIYSASSGDDGSVCISELAESGVFEKIVVETSHVGGIRALAVETTEETVKVLTFSYDQVAELNTLKPGIAEFEQIGCRNFDITVPDGEAVEFVPGGFVAFGNGIQFIHF